MKSISTIGDRNPVIRKKEGSHSFKFRKAIVVKRTEDFGIGEEEVKPTGALIDIKLPKLYDLFKQIYFEDNLNMVKSKVEEGACRVAEDPSKWLERPKEGENPVSLFSGEGKSFIFLRGLYCEEKEAELKIGWLKVSSFYHSEMDYPYFWYNDQNPEPIFSLFRYHYGLTTEFPIAPKLSKIEEEGLVYLLLSEDHELYKLFGRIHGLRITDEENRGYPFWMKMILAGELHEDFFKEKIYILNISRDFLRDRKLVAKRLSQQFRIFMEIGSLGLTKIEKVEIAFKDQ